MDYIPFMSQLSDHQISTDHQELFQMISGFHCKVDPLDQNHQIQIVVDQEQQLGLHDQVHPPTPSREGRRDHLSLKRRRPATALAGDLQENPNNDKKKKNKAIHREIERERRKEMAALYGNLRLLIPLEYLKGKRSISDQMHVATNYIKELQRKKQELCDKRDELKKLCNNSCSSSHNNTNTNTNIIDDGQNSKPYDSRYTISVRHSRAGIIEIVVNTDFKKGLIPLARQLRVLAGEGLDVVTCVSAKVNQRFLHTIQSEVVNGKKSLDDLSKLEEKLRNLDV